VILLAIDTATAATTVALSTEQESWENTRVDATRHAEHLTPMIHELFTRAELSIRDLAGIVVGVGPGPFTGLRVGIATGIAMSTALDIPIAGLCTLDVLAHQAGGPVTVVTRARRVEVFWADYDAQGDRVGGPLALPVDVARSRLGDRCVGDAVASLRMDADAPHRDVQTEVVEYPSASAMLALTRQLLNSVEPWPTDTGGLHADLDDAVSQGESTSVALAQWSALGRTLLPANPLYLRRPDAIASAQR
jgi:tRNA threonylcarbamoyl adenosine modification protein YeaZ